MTVAHTAPATEVAALKVRDIDSERMLLRVERGKGGRYCGFAPIRAVRHTLRAWQV